MRTLGRAAVLIGALALGATACGPGGGEPDPWRPASLDPYPNPFTADDPLWAPQPHRDRPRAAVLSPDERTLYVALTGAEDTPGDRVAAVDLARGTVRARIRVGRAPVALAVHPGGRHLAVANLLSNWVSIIDLESERVVLDVPVPWYTTSIAFSPDGARAYLANRWKDAVLTWRLRVDGARFDVTGDDYRDTALDRPMGTATAPNPDQVLVAADGQRVYVGSIAGQAIDVLDADARAVGRIAVHSPIGGMALVGRWLVASHIGRGTGFPPHEGTDGDEDGRPGDGTANVMFQDVQNELEVFDTVTLASAGNYTSDSICCHDYRDVDPGDPSRGARIPPPETWPPERVADLPPAGRWIVAGALPTRIAVAGPVGTRARLLVIMAASNEAQRLDLDVPTGALAAVDRAPALYATGFAPADVAVARDGRAAWIVDRLGESITRLDLATAPVTGAQPARIIVGDETGGAFPATDVELGELFNACTAAFSIDGDVSCVHCHRDGGNLDRVVAMPLQADRLWGSRQIQAYRGAADTRPWFVEAAMDQNNFFPVINELARKENYCCEAQDPLIWSAYPPVTACVAEPSLPGCRHVLDCEHDPPPECAVRGYGAAALTRNAFFLAAAERLAGRATSVGDSLHDAAGAPLPLDFQGITRAIGLFLLASPRLPPNPNAALELPSAARGAELYRQAAVGCAVCHPLPLTAIAIDPPFSPSGLPVRLPPVITPTLDPDGLPADLVTEGFRQTFNVGGVGPTEQGPEGIHLGVPQLRGLWDRAPRFFHDGRAHSLASALLPPGHPALAGAPGFNERHGVVDTHGGTSQLTREDLDDLLAFLLSL